MKRADWLLLLFYVVLFTPFVVSPALFEYYHTLTAEHSLIMSFVKFFVLATSGELIGLRIRTGLYYRKGFGLLSRAFVWGLIGISIKMAFSIFAHGTPAFLEAVGVNGVVEAMQQPRVTPIKVLGSFSISTALNIMYAPVMMTFHKITDTHIEETGGRFRRFFTPIAFTRILKTMNWQVQWNFVFKRTIPLFWIPAQTITFLLPEAYRVLFAAFLGIILGIILAIAALKGKQE